MSSEKLNAELRLANATKAVNDKKFATSEAELLSERVSVQFLHLTTK
jgi:hypothetical protein